MNCRDQARPATNLDRVRVVGTTGNTKNKLPKLVKLVKTVQIRRSKAKHVNQALERAWNEDVNKQYEAWGYQLILRRYGAIALAEFEHL